MTDIIKSNDWQQLNTVQKYTTYQHRFKVTILAEKLVANKKEQRIKEMMQLVSERDTPPLAKRPGTGSATANYMYDS